MDLFSARAAEIGAETAPLAARMRPRNLDEFVGQQDVLRPGVEDRTVVLIGATTENPFFALNTPLMSRSLLFRLEPLEPDELKTIVLRALADPDRGLGGQGLTLDPDALDHLVQRADGDARHALNALEAAALVVTSRAVPD